MDIANAGGLAATRSITVRSVSGEKFDRIVDYELGEKPEAAAVEAFGAADDPDIPF